MIFRKFLVVCATLLSAAPIAYAQDDAMRNVQAGMQGLAEAGKDPAMLAQLVKDMQVSVR